MTVEPLFLYAQLNLPLYKICNIKHIIVRFNKILYCFFGRITQKTLVHFV